MRLQEQIYSMKDEYNKITNEHKASKRLEETNKELIGVLQKERDFIYSELLKSNRRDVADNSFYKNDIMNKTALNDISNLGVNGLREFLDQKYKTVGVLTDIKDIRKNIGESIVTNDLPEIPNMDKSVQTQPNTTDQYLQTNEDVVIFNQEEYKVKEAEIIQDSNRIVQIEIDLNIEKDNFKPPKVKVQNNSMNRNTERKAKLNRIARRIKVNLNNQVDSRNHESNQNISVNGENEVMKSRLDNSCLQSIEVVENDSFDDMSDHSLERVKKALNILKTFKLSGDLIQTLTEDNFPNKTPHVYRRLWKEVEDRKIRDVAFKYNILTQNNNEIRKILRPQSEVPKDNDIDIDSYYKTSDFRLKNYSVIGKKIHCNNHNSFYEKSREEYCRKCNKLNDDIQDKLEQNSIGVQVNFEDRNHKLCKQRLCSASNAKKEDSKHRRSSTITKNAYIQKERKQIKIPNEYQNINPTQPPSCNSNYGDKVFTIPGVFCPVPLPPGP